VTHRPGPAGKPLRRRRPVAEAIQEAEHPATTDQRLGELAEHASARVRDAVVSAAGASDDLVRRLAADADRNVRLGAATNAAGRPGIEADLAASDDDAVRSVLAHTYAREPYKQLLRATQEVLSSDSSREVRARIGETTGYRDLYDRLLADHEPRVRGACADNPRATPEDMERLLSDPHRDTRAMALDSDSGHLTQEQLLRAARDPSADVRWATLFRAGAPDSVAKALADDDDETVRDAAQAGAHYRGAIWESEGEADAVADRLRHEAVTWDR
jgi:hypothetical protein